MKKLWQDIEKMEKEEENPSYLSLFETMIEKITEIRDDERMISIQVRLRGEEYSVQIYLHQNHSGMLKLFDQCVNERVEIRLENNSELLQNMNDDH